MKTIEKEIIDNVKNTCHIVSKNKQKELQNIIILSSDSLVRNDKNFVIRKRTVGVVSFLKEIRNITVNLKHIPTKPEIGQRLYMRCYRYFNGIHDAINAMYQLYPETISYPTYSDYNFNIKEDYNDATIKAFYSRVKRPLKPEDSLKIKKGKVINNLRNICIKLKIPFDSTSKRKVPELKLYQYLLFLQKKYKEIPANRHFEYEGAKRKFTYQVYHKRFGNFALALKSYRKWKKENKILL